MQRSAHRGHRTSPMPAGKSWFCRAGGSASFIYIIDAEDDRRIRQITDAAQQLNLLFTIKTMRKRIADVAESRYPIRIKKPGVQTPGAWSICVFSDMSKRVWVMKKEYEHRLPGVRIRPSWQNINKASGGAAASAVYRIVSIPIFCMRIPNAR